MATFSISKDFAVTLKYYYGKKKHNRSKWKPLWHNVYFLKFHEEN